jgi:hypothetical protein
MTTLIRKTTMLLLFPVLAVAFSVSATTVEARESNAEKCEDVIIVLDSSREYVNEGARFVYEIETKGGDVEQFSAKHLPKGLVLDKESGVIEGRIYDRGTYRVELTVKNDCSEDSVALRIVVREERSPATVVKNDPNVTLESKFIPNNEKGYVYLTQIPYTGAGDVFRLSLIGLALALWATALGYALLKPEKKAEIKNMFVKSTAFAPSTEVLGPNEIPLFDNTLENEEEVSIMDSEELQILRSSAHQDRVLFSEDALRVVVAKSQALGGPSLELLSTVIEGAKATYPREEGFLKIDTQRITEILS